MDEISYNKDEIEIIKHIAKEEAIKLVETLNLIGPDREIALSMLYIQILTEKYRINI